MCIFITYGYYGFYSSSYIVSFYIVPVVPGIRFLMSATFQLVVMVAITSDCCVHTSVQYSGVHPHPSRSYVFSLLIGD